VLLCPPGFYGQLGESCVPCSTGSLLGALCPGGETTHDAVVSLAGWWRFNVSGADAQCLGQTRRASTCPSLVPCLPSAACTGANSCDAAYDGDRCALCAKNYYRTNALCIPCPSSPWAIIVAFVLVAIAAAAAAYALHKFNVSLMLITIGCATLLLHA
jgi:hypothetical protein